ncbi:MAG: hypothetical protein AB9866_08025 [Syntrophobacteraceae bacterium]
MDFLDAQTADDGRHCTIDTIYADFELCIKKFELLLDNLRKTNRLPTESEMTKTALLHRLAGLAEKAATEIDRHAYLVRSEQSWLTYYLDCMEIIMQANRDAEEYYDLSEADRVEINDFKDYLSRYKPTLSPDQREQLQRFNRWNESLDQ